MKNKKTFLWVTLLCLALASFWIMLIKSDVAIAQYGINHDTFDYKWIDNVSESIYSLDFLDKNVMFLTGGSNGVFHMSKIPVVVKTINNIINWWISNILWWDNVNLWNSNNITVIWWDNLNAVDDNSNATLLWWSRNSIEGGMASDTPAVLLWWVNNRIGANHDANVIVWWSTNGIESESQNVNILWWNDVTVHWENIIAGWKKIQGGFSDSFIFNDGENLVSWDGSWMFFLKVANGVGFGTWNQEGNLWAISNGAVKLWNLDIENVSCSTASSENVWLIGLWNGCVVWCTSGSADSMKWELLDYGDRCEKLCSLSPVYCTQWNIDEWAADYTGFCTEWIVSTENAHMCNPEWLNLYKNVVFETYLIDSDDSCPSINSANNQCAFQCNEHYHLTWDQTWKRGGVTMCFEDCKLPWDESQYAEHNEKITAYSRNVAYCSSDTWYHDTCAPYKTELKCVDGTWYNMSGSEVTDLENLDYNYLSCTLTEYHCGADFAPRKELVDKMQDFMSIWRYTESKSDTKKALEDIGFLEGKIIPGINLKFSEIGSWKDDEPKEKEGVKQIGVRWIYELCVEYSPDLPSNQSPQNLTFCHESADTPDQYRYRFLECNEWYDLAPEDWVCRKQCNYNGWTVKHGSGMILYTWLDAHCPDACHAQKFQCYDGTLYTVESLKVKNGKFVDGIPQASTPYTQPICSLTGEACVGFNVNSGDYLLNQYIWTFTPCNRYNPSWILACTYLNTVYRLESCNANYYSNSAQTWCNECPNGDGYYYQSDTWSTSVTQCSIRCQLWYHVAQWGSWCQACWIWKYNPQFSGSINMNVLTYAMQYVNCSNCTNKPTVGVYEYTSYGTWINNCPWRCGSGYYLSGTNKCIQCPSWYYTPGGSWATSLSQCRINCTWANHVATGSHQCVACAIWTAMGAHSVSGWNRSFCIDCTNGPTNKNQYPLNVGYYYTTNGTTVSPTNCQWKCSSGYYLSGTYQNGECIKCAPWYHTNGSWQTQESACQIWCWWWQHISGAKEQCTWCATWTAYSRQMWPQPTFEACINCTSGPTNKTGFHYTSYWTWWAGSCPWECDENWYLSWTYSNGKCVHCPSWYTTSGAWATSLSQCKISCSSCSHVAIPGGQCIPCPAWKTSSAHTVSWGYTSELQCGNSCTKPDHAEWTGNTQNSCCNWVCGTGYYLNSAGTWCNGCPSWYTTTWLWATSVNACYTVCPEWKHVNVWGEQCVLCPTWQTTTWSMWIYALDRRNCTDCEDSRKPAHSHFIANTSTKTCNWECDTTFIKSWNICICPKDTYLSGNNKCESCNWYTSAPWLWWASSCYTWCAAWTHVDTPRSGCVKCGIWSGRTFHNQSAPWTSACYPCTNWPSIGDYEYTGPGTSSTTCPWQCGSGYYLSGTNKCVSCTWWYYTPGGSWAVQRNQCKITCPAWTHVATPGWLCEPCQAWYTIGTHSVSEWSSETCTTPCGTLPQNAQYVAWAQNSCSWECKANFYKNSAGTWCDPCPTSKWIYTSSTWAESRESCLIWCEAWTHVAEVDGPCVECEGWSTTSAHQVRAWNTETCVGCTGTLPACAHYMNGGGCLWACDKDCYKTWAWMTCEACKTNYHTAGSWALIESACKIDCTAGSYLKNPRDTSCTTCPVWSGSNSHQVSQWETSICPNCGNKPSTCSEYTSYGVWINNCPWQCSKDCYLSGTNKCVTCTGWYHTDAAWSTSRTWCKINCSTNKYVATPGWLCISCPQRTTTGAHTVLEWNKSPWCVDSTQGCPENQYNWIIDHWMNACYDCPGWYSSSAWSLRRSDCNTMCDPGWHVVTWGNACVLCWTWKTTNWSTIVHVPDTFECTNCPSTSKPEHSHFIANTSTNTCNWACDDTFIKNGNSCVCPANQYYDSASNSCKPCQNWYTSAPWLWWVNSCLTGCAGWTHVVTPRGGCVECGIWSGRSSHAQPAPWTSVCSGCTNGPTNKNVYTLNSGYFYTSYATEINPTNCSWQCSADFYLSWTYENGSCEPCPPWESSLPWSVWLWACGVDCGPNPSDGYWIPTN